jgi:hypothetical protein
MWLDPNRAPLPANDIGLIPSRGWKRSGGSARLLIDLKWTRECRRTSSGRPTLMSLPWTARVGRMSVKGRPVATSTVEICVWAESDEGPSQHHPPFKKNGQARKQAYNAVHLKGVLLPDLLVAGLDDVVLSNTHLCIKKRRTGGAVSRLRRMDLTEGDIGTYS